MPLSRLPALVASAFLHLAHWLDRRSAARLPRLLGGILFARGRRTVPSWFRAAARPLLNPRRLAVALDDTPTPRYGPCG
jgi:hypothetical protein